MELFELHCSNRTKVISIGKIAWIPIFSFQIDWKQALDFYKSGYKPEQACLMLPEITYEARKF